MSLKKTFYGKCQRSLFLAGAVYLRLMLDVVSLNPYISSFEAFVVTLVVSFALTRVLYSVISPPD